MSSYFNELRVGLRARFWNAALEQEEFVNRLLAQDKYQEPKNLNRFEHRMFSQSGEDGIIQEIFRRIGEASRSFVEIGAADGLENNTTSLLVRGWTGHWIEADRRRVARIRVNHRQALDEDALVVERQRITAENVRETLDRLDVEAEPDLLSIDIDGNDYWVWRAITLRPRLVVIEYNAFFQPDVRWVMSYDPVHAWNGTTYHGASLASLVDLGQRKGYALVGCTLAGQNAFFVREDLVADRFQEPYSAECHWEPKRLALSVYLEHPRGFGGYVRR